MTAVYRRNIRERHNKCTIHDRYNWLTGVEVVTLSTDAQRSSSQQGINYFFRSNTLGKEKSFVVEVVAVDFAASSRLVSEKLPRRKIQQYFLPLRRGLIPTIHAKKARCHFSALTSQQRILSAACTRTTTPFLPNAAHAPPPVTMHQRSLPTACSSFA